MSSVHLSQAAWGGVDWTTRGPCQGNATERQEGRRRHRNAQENVRSRPTSPCKCPSGKVQMCTCAPPQRTSVLFKRRHAPRLSTRSESEKWKCYLLSCLTLYSPTTVAHWLFCPWDFPGKNTGVGCHALLEGIFPIQGSNPGLLPCQQILYHLSHQESPSTIRLVTNHQGPAWLDTDQIQQASTTVVREQTLSLPLPLPQIQPSPIPAGQFTKPPHL